MASQWVINNKKVKDWTIGGKKVKSITLANGKVLNFGAPTIKASEYTEVKHLTGDLIAVYGYTGTLLNGFVDTVLQGKLILEIKNTIGSESWTPDTAYIVKGENNGLGLTFNFENETPLHLLQGHKYQFENGKDPIDLGTF